MALPSVAEREARIRAYAVSIGIDPDVAVAVARSEGLAANTWQSNLTQPYGREQSYGDYQLHVDPTGKRPGLGNEFWKSTGMNPSDPNNWWNMNKFALDKARTDGWGAWMGAKAKGITGFMGIGGQPAPTQAPSQTEMRTQPGSYSAGEYVPSFDYAPPGLLDADPSWLDTNGAAAAEAGMKILDKAQKKKDAAASAPPLQAQVLQPLQRFTLKGKI